MKGPFQRPFGPLVQKASGGGVAKKSAISPFLTPRIQKYWSYYPHRLRASVSPVCGIVSWEYPERSVRLPAFINTSWLEEQESEITTPYALNKLFSSSCRSWRLHGSRSPYRPSAKWLLAQNLKFATVCHSGYGSQKNKFFWDYER